MPSVRLPKRFELVREIGRGGMGAVYEAIDTTGGARVAIKTLPSHDPIAIARFKREFRALSDIHHPNLVSLGELFCEDGEWAFSMDLIEGTDLFTYLSGPPLRQEGPAPPDSFVDRITGPLPGTTPAPSGVRYSDRRPPPVHPGQERAPYDEGRLRASFLQLARAVEALHAAGKIHRDIKPSNVRVRHDGQVFLLDFGLVTELTTSDSLTGQKNVLGTPAYMAPEQASGGTVGAFSDWYAVGVVLFEALTGRLPFDGQPLQIIMAKQTDVARRVKTLVPSVPADLDELCARLLEFDPAKRPSTATILRSFAPAGPSEVRIVANTTQGSSAPPFVGRTEQLALLEAAFAKVLQGRPAAVVLEGDSGTGKSFLAKRFLDQIFIHHPSTFIVSGRCFENETVPYNAWDSAIESLASQWMRLGVTEAGALLPSQIAALTQTFPALRRVPAVTRALTTRVARIDPREIRGRAFTALRDLFERATQWTPVIIFLEDVQWADHDSISLLAEVLREPTPPPILFLATARPLKDYPQVERELREALPRTVERCTLAQLPHSEAVDLAMVLLSSAAPAFVDQAELIASESGGHALFITELTRYIGATGRVGGGSLSLSDALWARVAELPPLGQALLTVLAVAARPVPDTIALQAAGVRPDDGHRILGALRAGHLIRSTRVETSDRIETYHDRVRRTVLERTPPDTHRAAFEQLALAFEGTTYGDSNVLTELWRGAGDLERAGAHAWRAADESNQALAFDRAAWLYEVALQRPSCTTEERYQLHVLLGDALAKAGRGREAARAYEAALTLTTGRAGSLELEQKVCEQHLRTGNYQTGIEATKRVLSRVGLRWPASMFEVVFSILMLRLLIEMRIGGFRSKDESTLRQFDLTKLEVCANIAAWLHVSHAVHATLFLHHATLFALQVGAGRYLGAALSELLVPQAAIHGGRSPRQVARLEKKIRESESLTKLAGRPYEQAIASTGAGMALVLACRPRKGVALLEAAEDAFREQPTAKTAEIVAAQLWAFRGYFYLGEFAKLVRKQPAALQAASDRRDLFGTTNLRIAFANFAWLVRDEPDTAAEALDQAVLEYRGRPFSIEAQWGLIARINHALYTDRPSLAAASLEEGWPALERSFLRRAFGVTRFESSEYRARTHLSQAEPGASGRAEHIGWAKRWTRDAASARAAYAPAGADLLRAQIAFAEGDEPRTVALLRRTIPELLAIDLCGYAVIARRALGKLVKGDEGTALVRESEALLEAQLVKNIPALCRCLAPGFARLG